MYTAAEAARSRAAATGSVLAAPALAAPALAAPALAAPALAVPALAAPALAAPALAAPALAAPALAASALAAPALAAPALAASAVWAEEEDSTTGLYVCIKPTTTVAVGGLRRSCPASCLPVLSSKAWPSGSISSLWALKKSTPKIGKATSAKRNFQNPDPGIATAPGGLPSKE